MKSTLLLLLLTLSTTICQARQQPYDFGDVPKQQLQKSVYSIDSTANAVVLFDQGESYMDISMKVRYKQHTRIKILTDKGLEQGDIAIGFRKDDPEQKITDLEVVTYNLLPNGEVKEQKIGKREAFEEEVTDNWSLLKFSVPGIKKGSVFEYRYEMISESPVDYKDWQFQKEVPVLWSKYTAKIPQWFDFLTFLRSYYPLDKKELNPYKSHARIWVSGKEKAPSGLSSARQRRQNQQRSYMADLAYMGTEHVWLMKDLPAIVDEPYIYSAEDYSAKILLQLHEYEMPQSPRKKVLTSWLDFIKLIEESDAFGSRLRSHRTFRKDVEKLQLENMNKEEQVITLYNHVRDRMNWNKEYRLLITDDLDDLYNEGTANSTEINMILVQLLREAGLDADPLILSTRSNGEILDMFPIVDQFNHTLAYLKIDEKEYLLDATQDQKPFNILTAESQNGNGLRINAEKASWVPLVNKEAAKRTDLVILQMAEDGSFSGTLESSYKGYFSYNHSKKFSNEDSLEVIHETVFDGNESILLDSLNVNNDVKENNFTYKVQINKVAENMAADVIYFNPFFLKGFKENPFKREERKYPVDFDVPYSSNLIMRVTPPEGFVADELPKSRMVRLPNGLGEFKRIVQPAGNVIVMVFSMKINTYKVMPDQYPYLRQMFQELVDVEAENWVFKKS